MAHFILRDLVKGGRWALEVDGESFLIGRSRDADVCIRDTTVSKKHCQISRREVGTFRFKDLGSRNGTFINELRTNSGPIEDGDELRIGNFSIVFYRNAAPAGAGATATLAETSSTVAALSTPQWESADWESGAGEATIVMPADAVRDEILDSAPTPAVETPPAKTVPAAPSPKTVTPRKGTPPKGTPVKETLTSAATNPSRTRRPKPARQRTRPLDDDELTDGERPSGHRLAARRGMPGSSVVLFCLFSLLVGIGLGILIGRAVGDSSTPQDDDTKTITAPKTTSTRTTAQRVPPKPDQKSRPATPTSPISSPPPAHVDPSLRHLVGARSDLDDREVSHRTLHRLFLDVLDRTPTRGEEARFLALPHARRWQAVRELTTKEPTTPTLTTLPGTFQAFLGRLVSTQERDALLKQAQGSVAGVGAVITSSALYGSAGHARDRSPRQRARALWVDLLDEIPTADNAELIRSAIANPATDLQPVVRTLIHAEEARGGSGPRSGETPGSWVERSYLRFLLRLPTSDERREAIAEMNADGDGWRRVLLALSLDSEYLRY